MLNTKRGHNEKFKNFELRFEAQVAKFHAHSDEVKLPEAMVAFMLLANANPETNHRISVLAAAAPTTKFETTSTTADYMKAVTYESIASVLRHCDRSISTPYREPGSLSASYITTKTHQRRTLTPEQLADFKSKSRFRRCGKFGHWASDHKPDGSLKTGVKSFSEKPTTVPNDQESPKKTLKFNMAKLSSSVIDLSSYRGPLLDDGAPYSGMGAKEFQILQPFIAPNWSGDYDPLPDCIADRPFWQYGCGNHSSESRKIIGSIFISAKTDGEGVIQIRHLIIQGSSQWLIGRNVTKHCNIVHINGHYLQSPSSCDYSSNTISLLEHDFHSYVPIEKFLPQHQVLTENQVSKLYFATATVEKSTEARP